MNTNHRPSRVRSYLRVSSDKQATRGTSLDGQREAHLAYCAARDWPEPIFYVEVESASDLAIEKRDEQLRIQREAEASEAILVTVLDRWSRDVPHAVSTVRSLIKRGVWVILFQDHIDASTPEGDWMLVQRAAMAEQERKRLIERTVVRRRQLHDSGLHVYGAIPLGYRRERRRLLPVEEEAAVIREAFTRIARGEYLADVAETLPVLRGRQQWRVPALFRLLNNRALLGESRRSDGTWVATHEPIVTLTLWERAHEALRARAKGGRRFSTGESARRLLRGVATCAACGARVSVRFGSPAGRQADVDAARVHYYVCRGVLAKRCHVGWVRAYAVDASIAEQVLERLVSLRDELARPAPLPKPPPQKDHAAALARVNQQRARAVDLATSGAMSPADLRNAIARYDAQAATIHREVARAAEQAAAVARAANPEARQALLGEVHAIETAWQRMTIEQRREVLALLAARVEIGRDGVRVTWRTTAELADEAEARRIT